MLRLLKFLFIKRTLNFFFVIISYFVYHWNGQLNFRKCKNLFRPYLSVSFIKCFLFFVILTLSSIESFGVKFLTPNSGHRVRHIYFRFPYDLPPWESFLLLNELHYCSDRQASQVYQQIFLYY